MRKGILASLALSSVLLSRHAEIIVHNLRLQLKETTTTAEAVASASAQKIRRSFNIKRKLRCYHRWFGVLVFQLAIQAKEAGLKSSHLGKNANCRRKYYKIFSWYECFSNEIPRKKKEFKDSNDKFYEESLKGGHGTNNLNYFVT